MKGETAVSVLASLVCIFVIVSERYSVDGKTLYDRVYSFRQDFARTYRQSQQAKQECCCCLKCCAGQGKEFNENEVKK